MIITNNKNTITSKLVLIWQKLFLHITFLLSGKVLVVFNISRSHPNTNLLIRRSSHEGF